MTEQCCVKHYRYNSDCKHCQRARRTWFVAQPECLLPSWQYSCLSSSVQTHTKIINIFVHFGVNKTISAHQSNKRQYLDTVNFRDLITKKKSRKEQLHWFFCHVCATMITKTILKPIKNRPSAWAFLSMTRSLELLFFFILIVNGVITCFKWNFWSS